MMARAVRQNLRVTPTSGGIELNANAALKVPTWRNLVWVGVVASVVAWAWAWYVDRGAQVFMLVVALATVAFAYRAVAGMRLAIVGLMVASFAMFLASLYWMFWVMMPAGGTSGVDMLTQAVFPLFASVVLLLGAVTGYRHSRDAANATNAAPKSAPASH